MQPKLIICITAFSLFVASFFVAKVPLTPAMALVSSLFVVVFAAPSYWSIIRHKGTKFGLGILALLGLYALAIETSAIKTGFPYGDFIYHDLLGGKLLNTTPWTVAFAYPPILLLAYWFSRVYTAKKHYAYTIALTAVTAMFIDLVLDPAAVRLGFWEWSTPGHYYGVPLVNFLGWLLSGAVGGLLLIFLLGKTYPKPLAYSGMAILWFWTFVNVFLGQVVPAVIGIGLVALFMHTIRATPDTIRS